MHDHDAAAVWLHNPGDLHPAAFNPDRLQTSQGAKSGQLMPFGAGARSVNALHQQLHQLHSPLIDWRVVKAGEAWGQRRASNDLYVSSLLSLALSALTGVCGRWSCSLYFLGLSINSSFGD
jgi:hypothetical protein